MRDLGSEIERAAVHVRVDWDEARAQRAERGMHDRRRRRARRRVTGGALVLAMACVAGGWSLFRGSERPVAQLGAPQPPVTDGSLALSERSRVSFSVPGAARLVHSDPERLLVEVLRGPTQFSVAEDERVVRIDAGVVSVEVRAAVFAVERLEARTRVQVDQGSVTVLYPGGRRVLGASEQGVFPLDEDEPAIDATADRRPSPPRAPAAPKRSWQQLASDGDYDSAYEEISRHGAKRARDTAELLLAADVARLSHHPIEAVEPLRAILTERAEDPRAPLAAFTLGRVLLDELGRPTEAAAAFARAEALAPEGPLGEDAVAREVEAWSRAGDTAHARARAEEYLRRFPTGRRLRAVRRFGGLD